MRRREDDIDNEHRDYGCAYGIAVTTINPGYVVSGMTAQNVSYMPFLLSTDVAVRKIVRAIRQRRRVYAFPWQMAIVARLMPYIPGALMRRAAPGREPAA